MKVKIVNKSKHPLPEYSTKLSAGMDLRANIEKHIVLKPMQRVLVPTGIFIELPNGVEAQVRSRSGLAINNGISVLNTPGTIDADYRGELMIILINFSDQAFVVKDGERICQLIIAKHETIEWREVEVLEESYRDEGRFGHSGAN